MFLNIGWGWILPIAFIVLMVGISLIRAKVRANKHYYTCTMCGVALHVNFVFENNGFTELKKLKCPRCNKTEWFVEIKKKKPRSLEHVSKDAKKIAIIGFSGSGKSTLAKRLANYFYLPLLHLDKINFNANWKEKPREEVREEVREFMQERSWVIDGNYSELYSKERLELADEILIFMFSKRLCLKQVKKRFKEFKGRIREDAADGCYENLDKDFKRWVLHDGRTKSRVGRFYEIINQYPDKTYLFRTRKEVETYLYNKGIR